MSFLKVAVSVAAVAGVGFLGYKACKNKKVQKAAGAMLDTLAASAAASRSYEENREYQPQARPAAVVVTETTTEVFADEDNMGGVMSVAQDVQDSDTEIHMGIDDDTVFVEVHHRVAGLLSMVDEEDTERMFGFHGSALPQ